MKKRFLSFFEPELESKMVQQLPWFFSIIFALGLFALFLVLLKSAEQRVSKFFESEADTRSILLIHYLKDEFTQANSLNMLFESQETVLSEEYQIFTSEIFDNNYSIVSFYYAKPDYSPQNTHANKFVAQRMGLNSKENIDTLPGVSTYSLPVLFLNSKSFSVFPRGYDLRSVEELSEEIDAAVRTREPRFSRKVTILNEGINSDYIFIIFPHFEIDSLGSATERLQGIAIAQVALDKIFYEAISQTQPKNIYTELYELDSTENLKLIYSWKPRAQDEVSLLAELFGFTVSPHYVRRTLFGRELLIQMRPGTTFVGKYFPNSLPIIAFAFLTIIVLFHKVVKSFVRKFEKGKQFIYEAQKEIIENELRYHYLFDSISDLIFIADGTTGMLTEANLAAKKFMGYTDEEVKLTHFSKLHPPEEQIRILTEFEATKKGNIRLFETQLISKSGVIVPVEINAVNTIVTGGSHYLIGIFRDISARKKTEHELKTINAELEELNTRKDKFLSIIAHDMINPFSGIMGFSEHIVEDYETMTDKEVLDSATRVVHAANQAYRLLENLLRWAKLQFVEAAFIKSEINLEELLSLIVKGASYQFLQKKLVVQTEIQSGLRLFSDSDTVSFIIRNLIANAIKFSNENSVIEVQATLLTDDTSEVIKISVTDYGVGMTKQQQHQLFSEKTLISTQGTHGEKGTGLGLKLCLEFAERLGGKITVESEPGKGTTISLLIS